MMNPRVTFVIMAGGRGERLWPLVRTDLPKVCLSPDGRRSLLEVTIERLRPVWPQAAWLIVTTQEQRGAIRRALPRRWHASILAEPSTKNTAACLTLAAASIAAQDPGRVMVAVPADHWIGRLERFRRAMRTAIRAAVRYDTLATIGIRPTHPHPGLGYLCAGEPLASLSGVQLFRLARNVEKPSITAASRLLARPRTYWNSGMFIGTADTFLKLVARWLPGHARQLAPLGTDGSLRGGRPSVRARRAYGRVRPVSFDHGVLCHLRGGVVVDGRFPWADLGSWDLWAKLGRGAVRTLSVDSDNVTVVGQRQHLIATVGVRDLLVVQTPTATLICRADRAQSVREVVQQLAADRRLASFR